MGSCSFSSNSKRHREKHGAFFDKKSLQTMIACDENGLSLWSVSGGNGTGFTEEEAVWERRIPTHRALQMSCTK